LSSSEFFPKRDDEAVDPLAGAGFGVGSALTRLPNKSFTPPDEPFEKPSAIQLSYLAVNYKN